MRDQVMAARRLKVIESDFKLTASPRGLLAFDSAFAKAVSFCLLMSLPRTKEEVREKLEERFLTPRPSLPAHWLKDWQR